MSIIEGYFFIVMSIFLLVFSIFSASEIIVLLIDEEQL